MAELETALIFLLVFVRFTGLIVSAPILGSANFPAIGKIGMAGMSALLLAPSVAMLNTGIPTEPLPFAIVAAGELIIGLFMGLIMTMMFAAIQIGGQIMDMQSGFGLMNVFNPALETQFPIFGFFFFILAVLYLLAVDGHYMMIYALAQSFERVPLGGLNPAEDLLWHVTQWGTMMFYDAFLIAAPVSGAMMLAYVTMGLMGRVVPQIHLFVVGFPITIATALLVVAFSTSLYLQFLDGMFKEMFQSLDTAVEGLS